MEITTSNHVHADFPVGKRAKVISECVDFTFFGGAEGTVVRNSGGYLGVILLLDCGREFNFHPYNLVPLPPLPETAEGQIDTDSLKLVKQEEGYHEEE